MSDTTNEIKVCKSCQRALEASAFGAKQARCKGCIADARSKAKASATAQAPTPAVTPAATPAVTPTPLHWDEATKPKRALSPDEQLSNTITRADVVQKVCNEHGPIVGANLSTAYARRSVIRCRQCENLRSRNAKSAKRAK